MLAGIPALSRALQRGDGTWINMPQASKRYWFTPERRAAFRVRFQGDTEGLNALTGVLLVGALAICPRAYDIDRRLVHLESGPVQTAGSR